MPNFVAIIKLDYKAEDESAAQLYAAVACEAAAGELDTVEDDDVATVTQVTSFASEVQPEELILRLAQVRNDLFRTKFRECFEMAKQLDIIKHALQKRLNPEEVIDYDYGRILAIAYEVITKGENPSD